MLQKAINKYRSLSKPVKASMWFLVCSLVSRGISFFTLPIFSRLLTTSEYGIITTYQSWCGLLSIVITLTIWGGVFNVAMVKYSDCRETILSSFQGLAISNALMIFSVSILFLEPLEKLFGVSKFLISLIYIELIAFIPYNLWSSMQRFIYEYKKIIVISLCQVIINPVVGIIAVLHFPQCKAEAKIVSGVAVNCIIGLIFFVRNQLRGKHFFDRFFWKYAYKFNITLIPHYLSMQLLSQSDRVMINRMCGSSDAGIYGVAYNFGMLLQILTSAVDSSLTPYILNSLENDAKGTAKRINQIVLMLAVITMAVICLIPDVFMLMLPESYHSAMWAIPPITAGMFLVFIYPLFGTVELYYEKKSYMVSASIIAALVNVIANYIGIKCFGYIAAAYTTMGCYCLLCISHYLFMRKLLKKHKRECDIFDIKSLSLICLVVMVFSLTMVPLYESFVIRWTIILITVVFLLCNVNRIKILIKEKN